MSYDIDYTCKCCGQLLELNESFEDGGTYALGGTHKTMLNVTYNYSKHYYKHLDTEKGIRWLYGKTGTETIERLESAIKALKDDTNEDYWEPTEGNAKKALVRLLSFAKAFPDGIWSGD